MVIFANRFHSYECRLEAAINRPMRRPFLSSSGDVVLPRDVKFLGAETRSSCGRLTMITNYRAPAHAAEKTEPIPFVALAKTPSMTILRAALIGHVAPRVQVFRSYDIGFTSVGHRFISTRRRASGDLVRVALVLSGRP